MSDENGTARAPVVERGAHYRVPVDKPGLSREFVIRSVLKLFDEATEQKRWGGLNFVVGFQAGKARHIERYFKETITEEK